MTNRSQLLPFYALRNWMNMSDAQTGEVLWQDDEWGDILQERDIHLPRRILQCRAVSREFQFSSVEMLQGLRLEQRIFFRGGLMEEWNFDFGFGNVFAAFDKCLIPRLYTSWLISSSPSSNCIFVILYLTLGI